MTNIDKLSDAQTDAYRREGYIVVESFFDDGMLARIGEAISEITSDDAVDVDQFDGPDGTAFVGRHFHVADMIFIGFQNGESGLGGRDL